MKLKELGELLREERLRQGLSLDDIKDRTKLSEYILQAIENGDASKLPVEVYAKSFIKSYMKELGLDSQEIRENLESLFPAANLEFSAVEHRSVMTPLPSATQSLKSILIVFLAFFLLGLGLWFGFTFMKEKWQEGKREQQNSSVQQESAVQVPALGEGEKTVIGADGTSEAQREPVAGFEKKPLTTALKSEDEKGAEKEAPELSEQAKTVPNIQTESAEKKADRQEKAITVPQETDTSLQEPAPVAEKEQTFKLEATNGECWLRAEVDGRVLEKYLYLGQSVVFSYSRELRLRLGNASVLQATLNGKPYPFEGQGPVQVIEILAGQQS